MTRDASGGCGGTSWRWAAAALTALAAGTLPACSMLKKGEADAGEGGAPEAAVAVIEAAAPAVAANEIDVTRYPDEKATAGSTLTTESNAEVRTEVGAGGKLVVVFKKGTEVDKVAEHAGHYLVVGDDPKEPTRKLMGWTADSAFSAGGGFHGAAPNEHNEHPAKADGGGAAPAPAAGFSCVKQQAGKCAAGFKVSGAVCRLPCKAAADCKGPEPKCNAGECYASNGCQ